MEILLLFLLLLVFLLLPIGVVVLFARTASLAERVAWLERRLERLQASQAAAEVPTQAPTPPPAEEAEPEEPLSETAVRPSAADRPAMVEDSGLLALAAETLAAAEDIPGPVHAEEPRETLGGLFERLVAGKLLIWLGGIALVLAAIFLIRYSIEVGLITPAARMIGAGLFGLALIGAGEYARRGRFADDPRIAQALVGAGIAVLYATVYGTRALYGLIDSRTAFIGMAAVTAAALGLSLRHGAPTAIMGLVGGFLTPLLVGSQNQSAAPLLAYLALLDIALFVLAWKRGWTWLAAAATVLSFLWSFYVVAGRGAEDALLGGLFIAALALAASLVKPGAGRQLALVQPLGLGLLQLAILVGRTDVGAPAWGLFGILSLAAILLAVFRREHWPAPPAALAFALLLIAVKAGYRLDELVPMAAIGVGLLFGGAGLALARRAPATMWTALAVGGLAGPWLILRYLRPELLTQAQWGGLAALLAFAPALLVWRHRSRAGPDSPEDLPLLIAGAGAALLAGAAVWDLVPPDWIAAGWLVVALALALAARRLGDLALGTVAMAAVLIAILRALWTLPELAMAVPNGLIGWPILAADLPDALRTLAALGVPALLLTALRLALPSFPLRGRRVLPVVAGIFGAAALYLWFKQGFGLADHEDFVRRGMLERTLITQALFVAGWLLGSGRVRPPRLDAEDARLAGTLLTAAAAARLVWFDMALFNPVFTEQFVGAMPVLNLILPAYLLSALWLYLARRRAGNRPDTWPWFAGFLLALTIGTTLMIRQGFQGGFLVAGDVGNAEAYGYSLAFLLLSIAVIVAGVRLADKALRVAGLILLTATIVKVFLVDAAALTGVLRILSFLVLGIALIGMGRLYGPILRAEQKEG